MRRPFFTLHLTWGLLWPYFIELMEAYGRLLTLLLLPSQLDPHNLTTALAKPNQATIYLAFINCCCCCFSISVEQFFNYMGVCVFKVMTAVTVNVWGWNVIWGLGEGNRGRCDLGEAGWTHQRRSLGRCALQCIPTGSEHQQKNTHDKRIRLRVLSI